MEQMKCIDLEREGIDFSDRASSFRVWKTGGAFASGHWRLAASGDNITASISVGFSTTESESESSTISYTLGLEVRRGTEFKGQKISSEFTQELNSATETSLTKKADATITVSCASGSTPETIGLWQWVTETSDRKGSAFTTYYICRRGDGVWNAEPACPPNACMDQLCTQCLNWEA